jgi:eukaryotic-like serine/threonine-protein kinase
MDSKNTSRDTETAAPVGSTTANGIHAESGDSGAANGPHRPVELEDLLSRWDHQYRAGQEPALESLCPVDSPLSEPLRDQIEKLKKLYAVWGVPPTETVGSEQAAELLPAIPGHEVFGEIGRGGMGVVYKACDQELGRVVAIKTIAQGQYATADQQARFRAEAHAIARLRHPNIIAIHTIGEYENRPYLSLEFAEGGSLAQRLAEKPMAAREAAALVETLARAVHAAHQAGVIHRDLKPSNVLRAADGTPKVSDFGVAKLLDAGSERTASGQPLGTPSYMAPEQADGRSKHVGPATDVYSLGAILYQALTGRPPFLGGSALETLNLVITTDVVSPTRLRPDMPRDLESICLNCLEKNPNDRYATAVDLAEDLGRFLDGRPTLARPIGPAGRVWRWSRRNPRVASLSAAVVVSLIAGTVVSSLLTARAMRAEASTRRERDRTQIEANRFKAVNEFIRNDLLAQASVDAQATLGAQPEPELKVRTALDRAADKIGERFANQPEVEASIRQTIGDTYLELGLFDQAQTHLERALELRRTTLGAGDPATLSAMLDLGNLMVTGGRQSEALKYLVPAMEGLGKTKGPDDVEMLCATFLVGEIYTNTGNDDAFPLLIRAIAGFKRARGAQDEKTLQATQSLSRLYRARNMPDQAERVLHESVDELERQFGPDHRSTLIATRALASLLYDSTGTRAEAERLWHGVLERQKRLLGTGHPETLTTMVLLAESLLSQHQHNEAEGLFREALKEGRRALDRNHASTITALTYLVYLQLRKGELKEAAGYLMESVAMTRSRLGPDSAITAKANDDAGMLLLIDGQYATAEPYLRDCLSYWINNHADREDHWRAELRLGVCLLAQKRHVESRSHLETFYNAMKPRDQPGDAKGADDLGVLIARITRLRDAQGQLRADASLNRLRADPNLATIVFDLQFPSCPFAP